MTTIETLLNPTESDTDLKTTLSDTLTDILESNTLYGKLSNLQSSMEESKSVSKTTAAHFNLITDQLTTPNLGLEQFTTIESKVGYSQVTNAIVNTKKLIKDKIDSLILESKTALVSSSAVFYNLLDIDHKRISPYAILFDYESNGNIYYSDKLSNELNGPVNVLNIPLSRLVKIIDSTNAEYVVYPLDDKDIISTQGPTWLALYNRLMASDPLVHKLLLAIDKKLADKPPLLTVDGITNFIGEVSIRELYDDATDVITIDPEDSCTLRSVLILLVWFNGDELRGLLANIKTNYFDESVSTISKLMTDSTLMNESTKDIKYKLLTLSKTIENLTFNTSNFKSIFNFTRSVYQ